MKRIRRLSVYLSLASVLSLTFCALPVFADTYISDAPEVIASDEYNIALAPDPAEDENYPVDVSSNHDDIVNTPLEETVGNEDFAITKQPEDISASLGQTMSYSVEANKTATYRWYYSKNGETWYKSSLEGYETNTITGIVKSSNLGTSYRCKVTSEDGKILYSESARNKIDRLEILGQPQDVESSIGNTVTYSVTAENASSYQWYYCKEFTEQWYKSTAKGADSSTIEVTLNNTTVKNAYRCKVTGLDGTSITTDEARLLNRLEFTAQPDWCEAAIGQTAWFRVEADNALSFQWYYSRDGGDKWYKSSAAVTNEEGSSIISFTVNYGNKDNVYMCRVKGTDGTVRYTGYGGVFEPLD